MNHQGLLCNLQCASTVLYLRFVCAIPGSYHALERRTLKYKSQRQLVTVRGGSNVSIPCPELAKVIQEDGTFKWLAWYYRDPETCSTEWCWLAGLNGSRVTLVNPKGRYANRTNLIQNGTLELYNVQLTDATNYKCKVKRINFTSPAFHHVTIRVDSSGRYMHVCTDLVYFCGTFVSIQSSDKSHKKVIFYIVFVRQDVQPGRRGGGLCYVVYRKGSG